MTWDELRHEYALLVAGDMVADKIPRVCEHALMLQIDPLAALGLLEDEHWCSLVDVLEDSMKAVT